MFAVIFSSLFAPLVFFGNGQGRLLGMTLWVMGMGTQESILKATVAGFVPADKRGSAYGIFNTAMAYSGSQESEVCPVCPMPCLANALFGQCPVWPMPNTR
jgi:hypothetical protein